MKNEMTDAEIQKDKPMITPNEKPSERAAMLLAGVGFLSGCEQYLHEQTVKEAAHLINQQTSCDSLAAENARLRAVLKKIVQNWKDGELHCDSVSLAMEDLEK